MLGSYCGGPGLPQRRALVNWACYSSQRVLPPCFLVTLFLSPFLHHHAVTTRELLPQTFVPSTSARASPWPLDLCSALPVLERDKGLPKHSAVNNATALSVCILPVCSRINVRFIHLFIICLTPLESRFPKAGPKSVLFSAAFLEGDVQGRKERIMNQRRNSPQRWLSLMRHGQGKFQGTVHPKFPHAPVNI